MFLLVSKFKMIGVLLNVVHALKNAKNANKTYNKQVLHASWPCHLIKYAYMSEQLFSLFLSSEVGSGFQIPPNTLGTSAFWNPINDWSDKTQSASYRFPDESKSEMLSW